MKYSIQTLHKPFRNFGIITILFIMGSCAKDDDHPQVFETPKIELDGSLWFNNNSDFTELDLKNGEETKSYTAAASYGCSIFNGIFICSEGEYSGTKTLSMKNDFDGSGIWTRDYISDAINYPELGPIAVDDNILFIGYTKINKTTYASTHHMDAVHKDTGDTAWTIDLPNEVKRLIAFNNRLIAELSVGSSTQELIVINSADGSITKRLPFTDRIGQLIAGSTSIFLMTWENEVISLDHNLSVNWTFTTGAPNLLGGYEIGNQFILYSRDNTVYSIDRNSGAQIWKKSYLEDYPLAIKISNDQLYIIHKKEGETDTKIKILNLQNGDELDQYTYTSQEELEPSATKYILFDQHLLLFKIIPSDNKALITLINVPEKKIVWEKPLDQVAYPSFVKTPSGYYE